MKMTAVNSRTAIVDLLTESFGKPAALVQSLLLQEERLHSMHTHWMAAAKHNQFEKMGKFHAMLNIGYILNQIQQRSEHFA